MLESANSPLTRFCRTQQRFCNSLSARYQGRGKMLASCYRKEKIMQMNTAFELDTLQNPLPVTKPVKKLVVMVTITNNETNGFQACVKVLPAIYGQKFSNLHDMTDFLLEIQNWEYMEIKNN
jgi:hypothetical protein